MVISDVSVTRPVFASVISLLLIAFGLVAFDRLPLREYPDIDPPVVSIETTYPGAAANVVETRVTEIIEDRIAGVEGIRFVESSSADGRSTITVGVRCLPRYRCGRQRHSRPGGWYPRRYPRRGRSA